MLRAGAWRPAGAAGRSARGPGRRPRAGARSPPRPARSRRGSGRPPRDARARSSRRPPAGHQLGPARCSERRRTRERSTTRPAPADATAELVELGEPEALGALDDHQRRLGRRRRRPRPPSCPRARRGRRRGSGPSPRPARRPSCGRGRARPGAARAARAETLGLGRGATRTSSAGRRRLVAVVGVGRRGRCAARRRTCGGRRPPRRGRAPTCRRGPSGRRIPVRIGIRPSGGVRRSETSRSAYRTWPRVRGIGVAVMSRTCGAPPPAFASSAPRCSTPKRCCSSTTASARSANATPSWSSACVPTTTAAWPVGDGLERLARPGRAQRAGQQGHREPEVRRAGRRASPRAGGRAGRSARAARPGARSSATTASAQAATAVLPEPTSPWSRRSIGTWPREVGRGSSSIAVSLVGGELDGPVPSLRESAAIERVADRAVDRVVDDGAAAPAIGPRWRRRPTMPDLEREQLVEGEPAQRRVPRLERRRVVGAPRAPRRCPASVASRRGSRRAGTPGRRGRPRSRASRMADPQAGRRHARRSAGRRARSARRGGGRRGVRRAGTPGPRRRPRPSRCLSLAATRRARRPAATRRSMNRRPNQVASAVAGLVVEVRRSCAGPAAGTSARPGSSRTVTRALTDVPSSRPHQLGERRSSRRSS